MNLDNLILIYKFIAKIDISSTAMYIFVSNSSFNAEW